MRRWIWAPLAPLGVILALVIVLSPFGGGGSPTSAHIADINGDTAVDAGDIHLEIDMDVTNGGGPCNPVDTTRNVTNGQTYTVAICLTSADVTAAPGAFLINLLYDTSLDTCVVQGTYTGSALDANPDANIGTTTFSSPALGDQVASPPAAGWDCSGLGFSPPTCDSGLGPAGFGVAQLGCFSSVSATLPVGPNVSTPLAEITFQASDAVGKDTLTLDISNGVQVQAELRSATILDCAAEPPLGQCFSGDAFVNETAPTETPTETGAPTDTPTETNTPLPTNTPTITGTPTETGTPTDTPVATSTFTPTSTSTFTPTPTIWAYIDKNLNNGDGPCDPNARDFSSTEIVGTQHQLGVCLGNVPAEIGQFDLAVTYGSNLDQCVVTACSENDPNCLDSNPDANAGDTTFGDSLGEGWNCNIVDDQNPPTCGTGTATIDCIRQVSGTETAAVTDGQFIDHIALAAIKFNVIAAGTDTVNIDSLVVRNLQGSVLGDCDENMRCLGATDTKQNQTHHRNPTGTPTKTVTATAAATLPPVVLPAATATPSGGAGPALVPPGTGQGSNGGGFPWIEALFAAAAGSVLLASGLHLGRRRIRSGHR